MIINKSKKMLITVVIIKIVSIGLISLVNFALFECTMYYNDGIVYF